MRLRGFGVALVAAGAGLAVLAATAIAGSAGRDQLRVIVQELCVTHWLVARDPAPCVSLRADEKGSASSGFAVLADLKGGAHFLLIPTRTIDGIESPELTAPDAPNYFKAAWNERDVLATVVGHAIRRSAVGLAVNSIHSRSQDQLHIHISCLRPQVYEALQAAANQVAGSWSPVSIGGRDYQAMRIMGEQLDDANPFERLADGVPGARDAMGEYTLLVAGMEFQQGPGFLLLAGSHVPGAESLLDSSCAVAD